MRSITSQPTLWRVPAYWDPGFPSPTTTFKIRTSADSTTGPESRPTRSAGGPVAMVPRAVRRRVGAAAPRCQRATTWTTPRMSCGWKVQMYGYVPGRCERVVTDSPGFMTPIGDAWPASSTSG